MRLTKLLTRSWNKNCKNSTDSRVLGIEYLIPNVGYNI